MAKHKQKASTAPTFNYPAVSVIVPLYNAEKYIGECLDSILNQTFQNFELIVVDDCSTDGSLKIAESYLEKFGERMTLIHFEKNSGGAAVPRNKGLILSCGEYIYYVDADDFIAKTALEELHSAAKKYDADVVYVGAYNSLKGTNNLKLVLDGEGTTLRQNGMEDTPTLTVDDPNKNLQLLLTKGGHRNPWTKFIRRKFLIENEITFPKVSSGEDFIWVIHVFCCAERFLRVPNAIYFYRDYSSESITRKKRAAAEQIVHWFSAFITWTKSLNELSRQIDILKHNPIYGYIAMMDHFRYSLDRFFNERMQLKPQAVYEILYRELVKENDSSNLMLSFLFAFIDTQQKNFLLQQQQFQKFAVQAQARIAQLEAEVKRLQT